MAASGPGEQHSKFSDEDLSFAIRDANRKSLSSDVRRVTDYWTRAHDDPSILEKAKLTLESLDSVEQQLSALIKKRTKLTRQESGAYTEKVSMKGSALDMTVLLQTRNFIRTLKDLLHFHDDLQTWRPGSDVRPKSFLFENSTAGVFFPEKYKRIYDETGKVTDVYKAAGHLEAPTAPGNTVIYNYRLDFRGGLQQLLNAGVKRELKVDSPSISQDALNKAKIPNLKYDVTRPSEGLPQTNSYDVTYQAGAEQALRYGVAVALGQDDQSEFFPVPAEE